MSHSHPSERVFVRESEVNAHPLYQHLEPIQGVVCPLGGSGVVDGCIDNFHVGD